MTTDRLAALLHEALCGPFGFHDDPPTATCGALAARLAAQGVTVGLDVERLAAAIREWMPDGADVQDDCGRDECSFHLSGIDLAQYLARAYTATPQPAEENDYLDRVDHGEFTR